METTAIATRPLHPTGRRSLSFWASLATIPLGVGALVGRLTGSRRDVMAGAAASLGALALVRWQMSRWFTDEPAYEVERAVAGLELRRYPARVEATTVVEASNIEAALNRGFRTLAGYLFGGNQQHESLPMTAPVATRGESAAPGSGPRGFITSFVMPPGRTLASLPRPTDEHVFLHVAEPMRVAALRFRGRFTTDNLERHQRELLARRAAAGLSPRGGVAFSGYDAPSTLPWLRRNEVWVQLDA
jgi:hypothetical protein